MHEYECKVDQWILIKQYKKFTDMVSDSMLQLTFHLLSCGIRIATSS